MILRTAYRFVIGLVYQLARHANISISIDKIFTMLPPHHITSNTRFLGGRW
jgi:hypothetical protein